MGIYWVLRFLLNVLEYIIPVNRLFFLEPRDVPPVLLLRPLHERVGRFSLHTLYACPRALDRLFQFPQPSGYTLERAGFNLMYPVPAFVYGLGELGHVLVRSIQYPGRLFSEPVQLLLL